MMGKNKEPQLRIIMLQMILLEAVMKFGKFFK